MTKNSLTLCLASVSLVLALPAFAQDPLPSWNDTPLKASLIEFVNTVTKKGGAGYVPPADRIAVFDNDGTLCSEQPMYTQFAFGQDRAREQAAAHPEWKTTQPFKAALENDVNGLGESEINGLTKIVAGTHVGKTTAELEESVNAWLATAKHPTLGRPYTELVYQPMLEMLDYLRANGFHTYIVTGSVTEFLRAWSERVYGIPPEQVIGSTIETELVTDYGVARVAITGEPAFLNNRNEKALAIDRAIGRRPILAVGNSDGDLAMLRFAAGSPQYWTAIVHHTDASREFAYDRESLFGRLDKGLNRGGANTWQVVDMQKDWRTIFPPTKTASAATGTKK